MNDAPAALVCQSSMAPPGHDTCSRVAMPAPLLQESPPTIIAGLRVARARPAAASRTVTLVLGAIPQETELVIWALQRPQKRKLGPFPYVTGTVGKHRVVVAVTGIGKTCATMVTTLFVEKFRPREVLMCGTASRINPAVRNGDVIIGEITCNHDFGSLGENYRMEYFAAEGPLRDHAPIIYPGARRLLAAARRAQHTHVPETATQHSPAYLPVVRFGRITSGDQFGIPAARIEDILRQLKPDLMEMESGSVAEVCHYFATPFLCIRSGSNRTQNSPDNDYRTLSPFASRQAALFTVSLLRELAGLKPR